MNTITFTIESRRENVALVGEAIHGLSALTPLSETDNEYLKLAVIEAVNNAILHAYEDQSGYWITITWTLMADCLEITVSDQGKPMAGVLSRNWPAIDQEGGRGGPIMWTCTDSMEYRSAGETKTIILVKNFESHKESGDSDASRSS